MMRNQDHVLMVLYALSFIIGPSSDSEEDAALDALKNINNQSICSGTEYGGLLCK